MRRSLRKGLRNLILRCREGRSCEVGKGGLGVNMYISSAVGKPVGPALGIYSWRLFYGITENQRQFR